MIQHVFLDVTGVEFPDRNLQLQRIVARVAAATQVTTAEILGPRRTARVAAARHLAMALARATTDLSLMEIGEFFDRDHGTVIWAVRSITSRREFEPELARMFTLLSQAEA